MRQPLTQGLSREGMLLQHQHVATANWQEKHHIPQLQTYKEEIQRRKSPPKKLKTTTGGVFSNFNTSTLSFAEALPGNSKQNNQTYIYQDPLTGLNDPETYIKE
jgi:hypothetical protein